MSDRSLTVAQRFADLLTEFSGSWTFIFVFCGLLVLWFCFQPLLMWAGVDDPWPYIFLNLVLTVVSTLQGPVILMSQNRQTETDRTAVAELQAKLDRLDAKLDQVLRIVG